MEKFIETLWVMGRFLLIAIIIGLIIFIFWNVIFYPYVKKYRIDDLIKDQYTELEEIRVKKVDEYEAVNKLLVEKAKLQAEVNELKAENEKLKIPNEIKDNE